LKQCEADVEAVAGLDNLGLEAAPDVDLVVAEDLPAAVLYA
jgi:hypothetical protein